MACTMPDVKFITRKFKRWFEHKFGDLCRQHDEDYAIGGYKFTADLIFCSGIAWRGYPWLSALVLLAVNLPWVWAIYFWRKCYK